MRTAASRAALPLPRPNWLRQRKTMLVAISWRRATAATLTPGACASITIARFRSGVKLRRLDRPSRGGSAAGASVKTVSVSCALAPVIAPVLIRPPFVRGRALG